MSTMQPTVTDTGNNDLSSSSTVQTRRSETSNGKSSTLRFAPDTAEPTESAKPARRLISSSDEQIPIRHSDSHAHRSYNTSDTTLPVQSAQPIASTSGISTQPDSPPTTKVKNDVPWYKRIAEKYGSITLENKASVARDHLALERTFLAWLRTSLSFASIGIAVTQLFRLNSSLPQRNSKRLYDPRYNDLSQTSSLPYSPFMGHAIPTEVLSYLQRIYSVPESAVSESRLGPTLLDQLLLLSADGTPVHGGGYSVTQFDETSTHRLRHVGKPLGATFIGISIIVLLVGFQRYFEAQHWIIHGKFPASRGSISLVAFVAFALIIASLVVIIVISPVAQES